jgi:hypothetical protein
MKKRLKTVEERLLTDLKYWQDGAAVLGKLAARLDDLPLTANERDAFLYLRGMVGSQMGSIREALKGYPQVN